MDDSDEITALVLADISACSVCPLCGTSHPHRHTPEEILIYRNGVKRGLFLGRGADEGGR